MNRTIQTSIDQHWSKRWCCLHNNQEIPSPHILFSLKRKNVWEDQSSWRVSEAIFDWGCKNTLRLSQTRHQSRRLQVRWWASHAVVSQILGRGKVLERCSRRRGAAGVVADVHVDRWLSRSRVPTLLFTVLALPSSSAVPIGPPSAARLLPRGKLLVVVARYGGFWRPVVTEAAETRCGRAKHQNRWPQVRWRASRAVVSQILGRGKLLERSSRRRRRRPFRPVPAAEVESPRCSSEFWRCLPHLRFRLGLLAPSAPSERQAICGHRPLLSF
jgi:hypothetical protein